MVRKRTSQWNFGELFSEEPERAPERAPERKVFTVGELTGTVKRLLERELRAVWVSGEISNYRMQASGHAYFTLKDSQSQLGCVLFRGVSTPVRGLLEDGCHVVLQGEVTVYEPRGQYQMVVRQVEMQGVGALQVAFEKLKRKLDGEGLFDPARKRRLPAMIERLGVVTSPTGAALRDVLHVVSRRHPGLRVVLAPSRVQGDGAAAEVVARAIGASALPVVSAVGHEIDFTISDFVADLRAATPSAAAELVTEGVYASRRWLGEVPGRMLDVLRDRVESEGEELAGLLGRMGRAHPRRRLEQLGQRLDDVTDALVRVMRGGIRERVAVWHSFRGRWRAFLNTARVGRERERVVMADRRLRGAMRLALGRLREGLRLSEGRLRLLSPQSVLDRGYSITLEAGTGVVVRRVGQVRKGMRLVTRLQEGEVGSEVI
ncbi:MAG: Exodeoxyribonuclease 7 large subunit [Verrucomicrobiota bacterium]